jgi:hypothetical protein
MDFRMLSERFYRLAAILGLVIIAGLAGCRNGARGVASLDAEAAATGAMLQWDKNGDMRIAGIELDASASLRAGIHAYDANLDGAVSRDEFAQRIVAIQKLPRGNTIFRCQVLRQGRPLVGAQVRLVPESFLIPAIAPASGATDQYGQCLVLIEAMDWSERERLNYGLDCGLYRVEITHPELAIPPRYNTASELGVDVALDTGRGGESATFDLKLR